MNTYQRNILIGLGALTAVGITVALVGAATASDSPSKKADVGPGDGSGDGSGVGSGTPGSGKPPIQAYVMFNPDYYWTGQRKEQAADILYASWQDLGSPDLLADPEAYLQVMNAAANVIFPENLTADIPFRWPQSIAEQTKLIGTAGQKKKFGSVAWKGMRDILFAVTGTGSA